MDYRSSSTTQSIKLNPCRSASTNCRRNDCGVNFENGPSIPSFFLTFAVAPSSFLGLHLNLLFGKHIDSTGFQNLGLDLLDLENKSMIDPSNVGNYDASIVEVSSVKIVQIDEMVFNGCNTTYSNAYKFLNDNN